MDKILLYIARLSYARVKLRANENFARVFDRARNCKRTQGYKLGEKNARVLAMRGITNSLVLHGQGHRPILNHGAALAILQSAEARGSLYGLKSDAKTSRTFCYKPADRSSPVCSENVQQRGSIAVLLPTSFRRQSAAMAPTVVLRCS